MTSVVSHWHEVDDKGEALLTLKAIGARYIRVSSMQYPVLSRNNVSDLVMLAERGFRIVPVIGHDEYARLSGRQWRAYIRECVSLVKEFKLGKSIGAIQILNEVNTALFTGAEPSAILAFAYFKDAVDILRGAGARNIPILAPGLTNESKTDGSLKISVKDFVEEWVGLYAQQYFTAWGLHYYGPLKKRYENHFCKSMRLMKKLSGKPVIVTETGCRSNPIKWLKRYWKNDGLGKARMFGLSTDNVFWYCLGGDEPFEMRGEVSEWLSKQKSKSLF